jgi:hypothetical protein
VCVCVGVCVGEAVIDGESDGYYLCVCVVCAWDAVMTESTRSAERSTAGRRLWFRWARPNGDHKANRWQERTLTEAFQCASGRCIFAG